MIVSLTTCMLFCNWEISQINLSLSHGVDVKMELDSRMDWSTVPWALSQEKLAGVYKLVPTDVTLYQYDKSP